MSSIVSIDTRGYDISMGPGFLQVGRGGGIAGNVYINGNVGIGTANPTSRLSVSGSIAASGSIDTSDLRINNSKIHIGTNAGLTNQGASSIAIGENAGTTNQSANSIQINATGTTISQTTASTCIIAPIRQTDQSSGSISLPLLYDTTTKEVFMNTRRSLIINTGNTPDSSYYNSFLFIQASSSTPGIINIPTAVSGFPATITIWNNSIASHTITSAGGNIVKGYGVDSTAYTLKTYSSVILQTQGAAWLVVSNSGGNPVSNTLNAVATTASTDTTTGALVVAGGAGIDGAVNIGGTLTSTGLITANNALTLGSVQTLNFGASPNRLAYITNGLNLSGTLDILNQVTGGNSKIRLGTNNSTSNGITIDASGNLGIGTTTPTYTLDVNGVFRTRGIVEICRTIANPNFFIEMGSNTTFKSAFIDFHTGTTEVDYDSRIIVDGGTGTTGGGNININAANININAANIVLSGSMTVGGSNGTNNAFTSFTSKKYTGTVGTYVNAFSITTTGNYGASYLEVMIMGSYTNVQEVCIKYELAIAPTDSGTNLIYVNNATVTSGFNLPRTLTVISPSPGGFELRQTTSSKVTTFAVYSPAASGYSVYVRYLAGQTDTTTGKITML